MNKKILLLSAVIIASMVFVDLGFAGLINYDRRNKVQRNDTGANEARTATRRGYQRANLPAWMSRAPEVSNRTERGYDSNRDGKLQPDEVKAFLQDVRQVVNSRGSLRINSDILNEYDKNGDGEISRYEIDALEEHLR